MELRGQSYDKRSYYDMIEFLIVFKVEPKIWISSHFRVGKDVAIRIFACAKDRPSFI